jgi:predicted membrane channel-forming protein YqfA (hemolysin III family)
MEQLNNSPFAHGGMAAAFIIGALIVFAIMLIPLIFYILTLQKALNRCAPENRAMEPGLVWLMVIPCVNIVWHFFVVINMAKSLGAEFQKRGIAEEPEPGKMLGLVMCILACCGVIPIIGGLFGLGYLVCWILYWVKIAGYSKKLEV